jgi:hypothetical protein
VNRSYRNILRRWLIVGCGSLLGFGAAAAANFAPDMFESLTPDLWSSPTSPEGGPLLEGDFGAVYANPEYLIVGNPALGGGPQVIIDSADAAIAFMKFAIGGPNGALTTELLDPTVRTPGGYLAQDVLALQLDIDFSDARMLQHPIGVAFGDLVITGLAGSFAFLNGHSVRDFARTASLALSGEGIPYSYDDLAMMVYRITASFIFLPDHSRLHYASDFAQAHLSYPGVLRNVTCADLDLVRSAFGSSAGQATFNPEADVNHDGLINILDLTLVARALPSGTVCN